MANIGTFKKSGQELLGEIVTLSVQTKGVRIVPETGRNGEPAPSHRIYLGRAEIGAACHASIGDLCGDCHPRTEQERSGQITSYQNRTH